MGWVSEVHELATRPWYGASDEQLLDAVGEVFTADAMLQAVKLRLVGELDRRDIAAAQGATNTAQWLRWRLRISAREARVLVSTAAVVHEGDVGQALADGVVNLEQATA